nr:integrase arm-type DNA-binding domain-containing protein [Bradyrhizobium sp. CCBAU 65884]
MLPSGKSQHYLHDTEQPGLALRMRATGGRTWAYLFTKPGARGTQRKTLGAWPKFNEKAARQAAIIAAGEVAKGAIRTTPSARPNGNSWPSGSASRWRT